MLGPTAVYPGLPSGFGDAWEVTDIGYNPLPATDAAFDITDGNQVGPKNLGEGYRRNTPVMYYAFSPTFSDFFGSNGEYAVQQAFDLVNGVVNGQTNVPVLLYSPNHGFLGDTNGATPIVLSQTNSLDAYSLNLSEFPLNSENINYQAQALNLQDVKSYTLATLAEEMGLADSVRYTWALHTRNHTGNIPCPGDMFYSVVQRNFDIIASPLNQIQYSPYVNNELYTYFIIEFCDAPAVQPPQAAARPIPADPLTFNPPVSSGQGLDWLPVGRFYTGLTRDDAAGLRFLYSTNNFDTPSPAYLESPAAGSTLFNYGQPQLLYTSNYYALVAASLTNNPATLQALFPGLVVGANPFTYFSNVVSPNVIAYFTNYIGSPAGSPASLVVVTNRVTNIVQFYQNSFANVVVNSNYPSTTFAIQTISVGPMVGAPAGAPFVTNVTYQTFTSNVVSGDYFIITNGTCPPNIIQTLQTNLNAVTNLIVSTTNVNGQSFVQNLISYFTNYAYVVLPCTLTTNAPADYQGIGRMQFIRVRDDNYDYQSGTFITPITNQYTMVVLTNGQYQTRTFQRVVTTPDFIVQAFDNATGPADLPGEVNGVGRAENFNLANIQPNLAGPGTIDPPTALTFSKTGTLYENTGPSFLSGPYPADQFFLWGSFDGTTNAPVVYPNGTSLGNLANQMLVQISPPPPDLPNGTVGVPYSVQLTVEAGGTPSYSWSLAPNSAGLPPGLYWDGNPAAMSSSDGVISGTPKQSGTFDGIVIQMTDSSTPPRTVQMIYSITIN